MNGVCLQIKELQFVNSETVVSIYKVSKLTPKKVILEELKRILIMAQEKAREDNLDFELYDFTLDLNVEDPSTPGHDYADSGRQAPPGQRCLHFQQTQ